MTDDEIIKSFEHCFYNSTCKECPCYKQDISCFGLDGDVLHLIKRQKEEIERLNGYINTNCLDCAGCKQWKCDCENIRAEAIKDFAERLKERTISYASVVEQRVVIDKLVKEMIGDNND